MQWGPVPPRESQKMGDWHLGQGKKNGLGGWLAFSRFEKVAIGCPVRFFFATSGIVAGRVAGMTAEIGLAGATGILTGDFISIDFFSIWLITLIYQFLTTFGVPVSQFRL